MFFSNALGDHILNLPAIRGLCQLFSGRLTMLVGNSWARTLLAGLPLRDIVETRILYVGGAGQFDAALVAETLGKIDLFLSLNPWHSGSVTELLNRLRPRSSVGFFPDFSTALPLDFSCHSVDLAFQVVRLFDRSRSPEDYLSRLPLPSGSEDFATSLRSQIGSDRKLLVVHAETKSEKRWPPNYMAETIATFMSIHPEFVVIAIGAHEIAINETPGLIAAVGLRIESAMALLCSADLFLGVDSFPLHVADFAQVPGVGLFGPTDAREFGFRFSPVHRHVQATQEMAEISVTAVVQALEDVLQRSHGESNRAPRRPFSF